MGVEDGPENLEITIGSSTPTAAVLQDHWAPRGVRRDNIWHMQASSGLTSCPSFVTPEQDVGEAAPSSKCWPKP